VTFYTLFFQAQPGRHVVSVCHNLSCHLAGAQEILAHLKSRLGVEVGRIRSLEPHERGPSGRLIRLKITGERRTLVIGKELEIRRALSRSHLYSSAFVVETEATDGDYPRAFTLVGAGWGHGVGLCQWGAVGRSRAGQSFQQIVAAYYPGATLERQY